MRLHKFYSALGITLVSDLKKTNNAIISFSTTNELLMALNSFIASWSSLTLFSKENNKYEHKI